ncbi:hypothetical protein JYB64_11425 [Algoriphagus aestuarii]|nr:hypothetical protein [Algoriphagus aestuarii]
MKNLLKYHFQLIWSILGLIATVTIWFLPWRFQVNDDQIMMWLVSGAYTGTPEPYAVFIHPSLSWVFSKAYMIVPAIAWYPLTWFLVVFLSYFVLLKVISKLEIPVQERRFFALLNFSILVHLLFFPQFTQVAGFATLAGFTLLFGKSSPREIRTIGYLMITLGFLIRFEAAVLISMGVFLWVFFAFRAKNFKTIFPILLPVFLLAGLVFGSKSIFEQNSEHKEFLKFNKARSAVIDHPVFYKNVLENEIEEGNEWFYFSRWFFEEGKIDVEGLESKKRKLDAEFFSVNQLKNTFERIVNIQKAEAFKSFIALILFYILLWKYQKNKLQFLLTWVLLFLILNHFYLFYGRVNLLFILVLFFVILQDSRGNVGRFYPKAVQVILCLGLVFHSFNFIQEGMGREIMKSEMAGFLAEIPESEPVFLEGYQEHMFGLTFNAKSPVPFINQGWLSRSPYQKKILNRFGVSSLKELDSFSLLAIRMEEPLIFPDYMKAINPRIDLFSHRNSDNFQFLRFKLTKEKL